jgi:Flp pilus assembly protein TadG
MKACQIRKRISAFRGDESGAVTVVVALLITVLLGVGALAIDIGHIYWVQNDLKKAAEAGALAGARGLWPQDLKSATSRDPDPSTAATSALNTTLSNRVEGVNLSADEITVEVGQWDYAGNFITPPAKSTDANGVRVTTRRNNVQMFLAQIFGIFSNNMTASATAVMDYAVAIGGTLPIAVNKLYTTEDTPLTIVFGPSPSDNGGWFAKDPDTCSAKTLSDYINNNTCPDLHIGDLLNLGNGEITSVIKDLNDRLNSQPGSPKELYCLLPVVETDSFNHAEVIVDFVPFKITEANAHGNPKYIKGEVLELGTWENSKPGPHPSGHTGGLSLPVLVQ